MAFCRVSYRDPEGIEHATELEAESLFEAVAEAVKRFRSACWCEGAPGPASTFTVEVWQQTPIRHSVALRRVEDFARYGTVQGPKDLQRKSHVRELLGITEQT